MERIPTGFARLFVAFEISGEFTCFGPLHSIRSEVNFALFSAYVDVPADV
jgi:hypothetical protein